MNNEKQLEDQLVEVEHSGNELTLFSGTSQISKKPDNVETRHSLRLFD
jgi:hypothetical protein